MDVLADLLGRARASGALFAETELRGRGGVAMPAEGAPLAVHVVSRGELWMHAQGAVRPLRQGDVVLVRAPLALDVTAGPDEPAVPLERLLAGMPEHVGVARLVLPGDGPAAGLLCGAYTLVGSVCGQLLEALPPVLVVPAGDGRVRGGVDLLVDEARGTAPGQQTALDRLLDLLLVHVLRAHFGRPGQAPPSYAALDDPVVGAALRALHADPARAWTVEALAQVGGLSRAAFARRFTAAVRETPLAYLTRWRVLLAQEALLRDGSTLAQVAREVGYASEYALSAVFVRHVGQPPGRWRDHARAAERRELVAG